MSLGPPLSILDVVPADQDKKLALLAQIRHQRVQDLAQVIFDAIRGLLRYL